MIRHVERTAHLANALTRGGALRLRAHLLVRAPPLVVVRSFANDKKIISDQLVKDVIADKQQYSIFPVKKVSRVP